MASLISENPLTQGEVDKYSPEIKNFMKAQENQHIEPKTRYTMIAQAIRNRIDLETQPQLMRSELSSNENVDWDAPTNGSNEFIDPFTQGNTNQGAQANQGNTNQGAQANQGNTNQGAQANQGNQRIEPLNFGGRRSKKNKRRKSRRFKRSKKSRR